MRRTLLSVFFWLGAALTVHAGPQVSEDVNALADALGLPQIIEVMREEGITNGRELADDMFPGRGGGSWEIMVEKIYDPVWMTDIVWTGLAAELEGTDTAPLIAFFTSASGRRIVALEVSARQALLDDAVEAASKDRLAELTADGDPLLDLVAEYVEVNDLLEYNVVGAMNSNYAFYTGLQDGGAFDQTLTEDQILTDVWSQEEVIRADTENWLYAFLAMAYRPLSEAELQAYIAISETPEGQALNRALFVAFDKLFVDVSHALGRSAATFVVGEDL
ncbi:MAG: hypothetical protein WBN04_16620 [Paracoccaceae bacterium]